MDFIVNNIGWLFGLAIVVVGTVIFFLFRKVSNKGDKNVDKAAENDPSHYQMMSEVTIRNIYRVDTNRLSVEYHDNEKTNSLDVNFKVEEDREKFDGLFSSDLRIYRLIERQEEDFSKDTYLNEVRRYLTINLENVKDQIAMKDLIGELRILFSRKHILLQNLKTISREDPL